MTNKHKGLTGEGTPGRQLEDASDRQAGTTGGLNLPGTDVNRETTQGDVAAGDPEGGTSLSVGDDHLEGPEQLDHAFGGPLLDTAYLESLFDDIEYPCGKEDVIAALDRAGTDHPISGIDIPGLIGSLPRDRYMNRAELTAEVRSELERRAHHV
jgi:hypothetical protein